MFLFFTDDVEFINEKISAGIQHTYLLVIMNKAVSTKFVTQIFETNTKKV